MPTDEKTMKMMLREIYEISTRPLFLDLEVGFRHSPLTEKEKIERYKEAMLCIEELSANALGFGYATT